MAMVSTKKMKLAKMVILLLKALHQTAYFLCIKLVFMVVKTNVDYEVAGAFVCERGETENIIAALKILKSWSPNWSTLYNNVVCCSEEINATEFLA